MVVGVYNRGMASESEVRGRRRRRQAKKKRGDVTSSRQPMRVREAWRGGESEGARGRRRVRVCVCVFLLSLSLQHQHGDEGSTINFTEKRKREDR